MLPSALDIYAVLNATPLPTNNFTSKPEVQPWYRAIAARTHAATNHIDKAESQAKANITRVGRDKVESACNRCLFIDDLMDVGAIPTTRLKAVRRMRQAGGRYWGAISAELSVHNPEE